MRKTWVMVNHGSEGVVVIREEMVRGIAAVAEDDEAMMDEAE
jgi:hypothetical protein